MNKLFFNSYFETAPEIITRMFPLVSYREKSTPGAGSPCYKTHELKFDKISIIKTIEHRNGDFTVQFNDGFLRFWKDRSVKYVPYPDVPANHPMW